MRRNVAILTAGSLACLLIHPVTARADIFDSTVSVISDGFDFIWPDEVGLEDFSLRLGVGAGTMPDYTGSDNYRFRVLPLIELRYKDIITLQGTRLQLNLLRKSVIRAGTIIALDFGRDEENNLALAGLGDVEDSFEIGTFIEMRSKKTLARFEFRQALKSGRGRNAIIELGQGIYQKGPLSLALFGSLKWSSRGHNQTWFGVTPAQSTISGLPVSTLSGGLSDFGINIISRYDMDRKWKLLGVIGYSRITGDAADSPIVRGLGSPNQFIAGIGTRYHF